jgi:monoterpene epsilon-lactone hydrolase
MTQQQREALLDLLRSHPLDLGAPLEQLRPVFEQMMSMTPIADGITSRSTSLGGIPAVIVSASGLVGLDGGVLLYFHGGAFVVGSAHSSIGLASELARRSGMTVISVDYRLAPESPFPAAIDDALAAYTGLLADGVSPERIALFGESAGGNIAASLLLAIKDAGLPMPTSAVLVSPWTNLELIGRTVTTKAADDPSLAAEDLRLRAAQYLAVTPADHPLASPTFGDLTGLPPLLIQVGSNEILLDDALEFGRNAAAHDVDVTIEIVGHAPHVFPAFFNVLNEGARSLDNIARFLRDNLQPDRTGL